MVGAKGGLDDRNLAGDERYADPRLALAEAEEGEPGEPDEAANAGQSVPGAGGRDADDPG